MRPDKSLPGDYKIEWLYKYNSDSNSKDNMGGYSDHNKGWPDNRSWEGTEQDRTGRRRSRPRDTARRKRAQRGKRKEHKMSFSLNLRMARAARLGVEKPRGSSLSGYS